MFYNILLAALLLLSSSTYADASNDIEKSIQTFFSHGIYSGGARAEFVEVMRWPADITGTIHWRMPRINNHPKQLSLIAEQGKGKTRRQWYVPIQLRWWSNAVVVKIDLPARTLLTKSLLTKKEVNIAGHSGRWWKDTHDLVGTRLTRPLRTGQTVYASYIKKLRLLKRGDRITIVANIGDLKVRASGKVMRAAGLGDRVQVQNIKSKKMLQAIVLDAGTVRAITGGRG